MSSHEVLRPDQGLLLGNSLRKGSKRGIVKALQNRLPSWIPGSKSDRISNGDANALGDTLQDPNLEAKDKSQITDILYGSPGERRSPIVYGDMGTIYEWRQHKKVFGHIYPRIKDDPEADRELQRVSQWEYYLGVKDTDGRPRNPIDTVFFKVVNSSREMTAVGSLVLNGVPWIPQGRRIAYIEQVIRKPDPEYEDQRIGSAILVSELIYAFYVCTRYQGGRGAAEVRASTIVDREAGEFNINELWLRRPGSKHDGEDVLWVTETPEGPEIPIQPWKINFADFEEALPDAIEHIRIKQPKWADRIDRTLPELQRQLSERTARLLEGRSSSSL